MDDEGILSIWWLAERGHFFLPRTGASSKHIMLFCWGLSKNCKLPKVITSDLKEEWKKRLASDWLNVNFLFRMMVNAVIVDGKLESLKNSYNIMWN